MSTAPRHPLDAIAEALAAPFAYTEIALKPGATTQDKNRCLPMPYADLRAYEYRLDAVVGVADWATSYQMTARGVVCSLTIYGVTKSGIGDYPADPADENAATSAQAQAFKRACSAFGLGRYLYDLPIAWCDYDKERKRIPNPERVAWEIYAAAGLLTAEERQAAPAKAPAGRGAGR